MDIVRCRMLRLAWRSALAGTVVLAFLPSVRAGLEEYVRAPDAAFAWKLKEKITTDGGVIYDLHLVSQVWQGIKWEHQLQIYQPKGVSPNATMLIYNTGGKANPGNIAMGMDLARKTKPPSAFLYHIPNQP